MNSLINIFLYPLSPKRDLRSITLSMLKKFSRPESIIADIGCGEKPLEKDINKICIKYIGVDLEKGFYKNKKPDVFGSAYETTLLNEEIDIVLSMQVMEHLEHPEKALIESSRILKAGGFLITSFPFAYPIHASPYDYYRFTIFGMKSMLERNGFEVLEHKEVSGLFMVFVTFLYNHFLYAKPFLPLGILLAWMFYLLHLAEGAMLRMVRKDVVKFRSIFVSNYVLVAKKIN